MKKVLIGLCLLSLSTAVFAVASASGGHEPGTGNQGINQGKGSGGQDQGYGVLNKDQNQGHHKRRTELKAGE